MSKKLIVKWYECGNSRGAPFSTSGKFSLEHMLKKVEDCTEENLHILVGEKNFPDIIFYDWGDPTKDDVIVFLKALKKKKVLICTWEEGTIGVSAFLSSKELRKEVELADYRAFTYTGTITDNFTDILRRFNAKKIRHMLKQGLDSEIFHYLLNDLPMFDSHYSRFKDFLKKEERVSIIKIFDNGIKEIREDLK